MGGNLCQNFWKIETILDKKIWDKIIKNSNPLPPCSKLMNKCSLLQPKAIWWIFSSINTEWRGAGMHMLQNLMSQIFCPRLSRFFLDLVFIHATKCYDIYTKGCIVLLILICVILAFLIMVVASFSLNFLACNFTFYQFNNHSVLTFF